MSRIAMSARPVWSCLTASVEAPGRRISSVTPSAWSKPRAVARKIPACTALGVKSSSRVASSLGRSPPETPPQPPMRTASRAAVRAMRTPVWWRWMARRVTFSRNLTLSLSRTCRCYCKYCAFATHRAHLHEPEEVERILDGARRHRAKELLVLTGEAPDHHPGVRGRLNALGFADFTAYVVWACERALERGLLPHTNLGVLPREDLARLREVTASQGLMLESVNPDLVAHQGSPTKHPEQRLATIRAAEELRIPFTSGILVGIGESEDDRMASLEALAGFGHIQEVILQNFVPHRRYYGEEPADIATEAAEGYWRTGIGSPPTSPPAHVPEHERPAWANEVTIADMKRLIAETRRVMPEVGIQIPPNLADWWPELVRAGATDLGGLSANGDHISPEHPFPSPS